MRKVSRSWQFRAFFYSLVSDRMNLFLFRILRLLDFKRYLNCVGIGLFLQIFLFLTFDFTFEFIQTVYKKGCVYMVMDIYFLDSSLRLRMSRPQNAQRPSFPFGNPFKLILPNGSSVSPRHATLLNKFEVSLAERLEKLNPKDGEDVLALSWMVSAIVSVCETHSHIKAFISDLDLSVYDWDAKWIDLYLDDSLKLLDMCNSFSSELAHFSQGHLLLQCIMHNLEANPTKALEQANSFINDWNRHISSRNPRLDDCSGIIDYLTGTTNLPKIKNSSKGKVLVKAMYGVKVHTLFVFGIFFAAFSGSAKLTSFQVPDICLWAHSFENLQSRLQKEVNENSFKGRFSLVKELNSVDTIVRKLHPIVQHRSESAELQAFGDNTCDLKDRAEKLSLGLDNLTKGVEGFFQILLSGRDALLSKFRTAFKVEDPMQKSIGIR